MRLSLAYEMQRPVVDDHAVIKETIEQCVLADRMGFDTVWFVEHHFLTSFSMSPCPEVIFGALSQLTKRIRLGFGVVILPYHHPVRVAERVAMVDHMSGGRVEFGTGRSAPYEQIGMGIDPRHTRAMCEESLDMIPTIWEDALFSWEGQFWNVPPRDVRPKPYQKPHPPIWVAALQPATYELAAETGIGVMALSVAAPSYLAPHIKRYKERVRQAQAGREVRQRPVAQLDHGSLRLGQQGRSRAGRSVAQDVLRSRSPVSQGPDPSLRAARRLVGRRARASPGELRALSEGRGDGGRARSRSLRRFRADRVRPVESDRRRHAGRARRARGRRSGQLSARHRDPRGGGRRRAAVPDGDGNRAARQGDDVDRDVRQARHPRAEEEGGGRSGSG